MSIRQQITRFGRATISSMPLPLARKILFKHRFGYFPNTRHPQTFQEKLNYRVLFDRRELLITASSKVESKSFVESLNVPSLRVPRTYWHGSNLEELESLVAPSDWILKPSHRSGAVLFGTQGPICIMHHRNELQTWLQEREYRTNKLWAYRHVTRELILEERLGDENDLTDYKFFVFDGKVALAQVDSGRFMEHTRTLYDHNLHFINASYGVPPTEDLVSFEVLQHLAEVASRVGKDFDFVRVDLYYHQGETYFGELTVYPGGGLSEWPHELDLDIGEFWVPFPPFEITS